jgi:hypothetical protein
MRVVYILKLIKCKFGLNIEYQLKRGYIIKNKCISYFIQNTPLNSELLI